MTDLDLDFVRRQFPAFAEPTLAGWAHFENAGGSYPCCQTIDRLATFYRTHKVQPYYGYPASQAAGAAMDEAYAGFAEYLNVATSDVHFGPSTSQNTYVLAHAFAATLGAGDEVVVSQQDHEANAGAWRRLGSTGATVREWPIDPASGRLHPEALADLLTERTRLVVFPHCSNVVGEMNPVAEITRLAQEAGAVTVVDGVAAAPHGLPDVAALGADVYLFSLYKTWGPHLGLMTVRREVAERLPNQQHFFNEGDLKKHLVPAGPDHAQIAAAAGVTRYLDAVHAHHWHGEATAAERGARLRELFATHERALLDPLLELLKSRADVRLIGPASTEDHAPTVSFLPLRRPVPDVFVALVQQKIMCGSGNFYGVRPLRAMDVPDDPGVIRLSFLHYTSAAEIDQLLQALEVALAA